MSDGIKINLLCSIGDFVLDFLKKTITLIIMIKIDDRTEVQKLTHKFAVVARDSFMSGWGGAAGGSSRVAWAFSSDANGEKLVSWVRHRSEMKNVNFVNLENYRVPKGTAHFHIYVAGVNHPAFSS